MTDARSLRNTITERQARYRETLLDLRFDHLGVQRPRDQPVIAGQERNSRRISGLAESWLGRNSATNRSTSERSMPSTGQDADWRHLGAGITAGELAGEAAGNRHATDPNGAVGSAPGCRAQAMAPSIRAAPE
jgi:hypothetical protein